MSWCRGEKIPEIRFTITEKLDRLISMSSEELGVSKSEYIKSLVLRDLRNCLIAAKGSKTSFQKRGEGK